MTKGDKERLRQQAAIAAMQGILANGWDKALRKDAANLAVAYADALVAELEKEG